MPNDGGWLAIHNGVYALMLAAFNEWVWPLNLWAAAAGSIGYGLFKIWRNKRKAEGA